jgi:hypothetical protein
LGLARGVDIVLEAVCVLAGDKLHHGVSIKARVLSGVKPGMVVSGSYRLRAQRGHQLSVVRQCESYGLRVKNQETHIRLMLPLIS